MLPVISALLAFVAGLFRSRASLCLEHLALRHQLAVYKQTVHRPRLRPTTGCSGRGCLVCGQTGKAPWRSFSRVLSSPGSASAFATTGEA